MRRLWLWPLSPFILGIYPVLYLYSNNLGKIFPSEILFSLETTLMLTACLNAFCALAIHNWQDHSLATNTESIKHDWRRGSLLTDAILFSSYLWTSAIDTFCPWIYGSSFSKWISLGAMGAIVVLCRILAKRLRQFQHAAYWMRVTNLCSILVLLVPTLRISWFHLMGMQHQIRSALPSHTVPGYHGPDVYYIILDGYTRADILANDFHYDNSPFIQFLKKKGFYVADESRSNYAYTYLSLASSLNMDYLEGLSLAPNQQIECMTRMQDNSLFRLFKEKGYHTVHLSSSWFSQVASSDDHYGQSPHSIHEFENLVLKRFMLRPFLKASIIRGNKAIVLDTLRRLEQMPEDIRPTFTLAHIMSPHPPYVFDRAGETPKPHVYPSRPPGSHDWFPKERYVDQVDYLNKLVEHAIERLLADRKHPPIIIVQGDHGAACDGTSAHPTPLMVRERMSILNAYYVPEELRAHLYPAITPVNSFRLVFNYLFHARFPPLPDLSYYSGPMDATPYEFIDVKTLLPKEIEEKS